MVLGARSQTIFSMRARVMTRLCGAVVVIAELVGSRSE